MVTNDVPAEKAVQKRVLDPEGRRRNILEAATKLFAEKGLEGTSIRDISSEAGEATSIIYYYFESKEDLFYSVATEVLMENLGRIIGEEVNKRGTCLQRLKRLHQRYIEFADEHPEQAMMAMRLLIKITETGEVPLRGILMERIDAVANIVREGIKEGEFKKVDPWLAGMAVINSMFSYYFSNVFADVFADLGIREYAPKEMVKFFDQTTLEGMRKH